MEMTEQEYAEIMKKLESNELYKKSKSIHKGFQYRQFSDPSTGKRIDGQQIRQEDKNGLVPGQDGYDSSSERIVIYSFKDGVLHSDDGEPAVQYPGHWEIWNYGLIQKVVADGGDTEEFWENGVPVRIETNLAERRSKEK